MSDLIKAYYENAQDKIQTSVYMSMKWNKKYYCRTSVPFSQKG